MKISKEERNTIALECIADRLEDISKSLEKISEGIDCAAWDIPSALRGIIEHTK